MQVQTCRTARLENCSRSSHLIGRTMCHDQKAVGFYGCLILDDAVFRDAIVAECCSDCRKATDDDRSLYRTFDQGNDHDPKMAEHDDRSNNGKSQKHSAEKKSPETAPERPVFALELHSVGNVIEADYFFLRMVALADDAKIFHVEAAVHQLVHGSVYLVVVIKGCNHNVIWSRAVLLH